MSPTGKVKKLCRLPHERVYSLHVESIEGGYHITCDEPRLDAAVYRAPGGGWSVLGRDGPSYEVLVDREDEELRAVVGQLAYRFASAEKTARGAARAASGRAEVKAPMPGKVVRLLVAEGDRVTAGQGVLLFEAMKMQNEIRAPREGTVSGLAVREGQTVEARVPLLIIK